MVREGLYLINSKLGWLLTGRVERDSPRDTDATDCTLVLGNWVQSLPFQISVPSERSIRKREMRKADELTVDLPTIHTSTTTCWATECETPLAEESFAGLQSPKQVRINPIGKTFVPMFRTNTVPVERHSNNNITAVR